MSEQEVEMDDMEEILQSLKQSGLSGIGPSRASASPYIEITEQPKQRDHRFRYPVEGRQAGSIAGERSSPDLPSYPAIKVSNLTGRARVVVSLVTTKSDPPMPHPHRLVGDGCRKGVYTTIIESSRPEVVFRKIGVQRTMNKEVENSLEERRDAGVNLSMEINKGKTGKKHNYDMKAVRLFFEVWLESSETPNVFNNYIDPVISSPIYDKKDTVLSICRVNISTGSVEGGDELFILCEKVQSDDIKVKFLGLDPMTGRPWMAYGDFSSSDVHRQYAIVCKTPKFVNQDIKAAVEVKFHLYRPSDEESSPEMPFVYKPRESVRGLREIEKKKRKFSHKDEDYGKFFTNSGQPVKTETLGASAQSCSGAPVSNPVSNAPSTLTLTTPVTSDMSMTRNVLRQHLMRGDPSLGETIPRALAGGTAQVQDVNLPVMFSSDAHMCAGTMIPQQPQKQQQQQQQQQPVSTDQGTFDIPAQAFLTSLATNQEFEMGDLDEERQASWQKINAIANELMSVEAYGGAVGGNERVIVQNLPNVGDIQFSDYGIAAFQDVQSTSALENDLVLSTSDGISIDINNVSNSKEK